MPNQTLQNFATTYLKYHARIQKPEPLIDIFGQMRHAQKILVCLPENLADLEVASQHLSGIERCFENAHFTYIGNEALIAKLSGTFNTLSYKPENISAFGLLSRQVMKDIKLLNAQVAIDLNRPFSLLCAHLCFQSGATLRISLEDENRDPFYNFQIQAGNACQLNQCYGKLTKYLSMTAC
ncbi:hypothetical protein KAH55_13280 [bacterium]|nr:hypothetical protein [bacterium]